MGYEKMAFQIMKDDTFLKTLADRYDTYATVQSLQRVGLKKYFGPRAGTVWVSLPKGPAHPVIQVVVPEWKAGQGQEWELLRQSYGKALLLAAQRQCGAIVFPLLTADNPAFPAYIDFKIAVDTIREFLENHPLDVYLLAYRHDGAADLREDMERYLSRHTQDEQFSRSDWDFGAAEDRFTIPMPPAPGYCSAGVYGEATAGFSEGIEDFWCEASMLYDEADDAQAWEEAPRKKAAPARGTFPKKTFEDRSAGRGPDLPELRKLLEKTDEGFSQTLLKLIDRTGKKDSDIYNKANVSRQHFSKIRNNPDYRPTKPTAIAFAIALELDLEQTEDLIGRAGYRLTASSRFDLIIMYFIERRNYNMFDINQVLYEFDQSLLGA